MDVPKSKVEKTFSENANWLDQGASLSAIGGLARFATYLIEGLLWLPPVMQEVFLSEQSDRMRSYVRPLNAALQEAAGRYGDLRIRS